MSSAVPIKITVCYVENSIGTGKRYGHGFGGFDVIVIGKRQIPLTFF